MAKKRKKHEEPEIVLKLTDIIYVAAIVVTVLSEIRKRKEYKKNK